MISSRVLRLLVVSVGTLLVSGPAGAWDPEIHVSFARAAVASSAAMEARLPLEYRDAFFRDVKESDLIDKDCRYHCSGKDKRDPAVEAETLLGFLTGASAPQRAYIRVQVVGRYVHYVADAVAPEVLRDNDLAPKLLNFFANQDFIFWRQPRPITGSLAEELRRRRDEAQWANANIDSANPAVFRLVVNTICDAVNLLPPRSADVAKAPDAGPVVFLVNRIDNGAAGRATAGEWQKTNSRYDDSSQNYMMNTRYGTYDFQSRYETWEWVPGSRGGGQSFYKANLMERKGVQLAELSSRKEKDHVVMRMVFFNNSHLCAAGVGLKAGAWSWTMDGAMPPNSVKFVEVVAPADVLSRRLAHGGKNVVCEDQKLTAVVASPRRLVYGNGGGAPLFDAVLAGLDITRSGDKQKNTLNFTAKPE